jgi:hypothetical protein
MRTALVVLALLLSFALGVFIEHDFGVIQLTQTHSAALCRRADKEKCTCKCGGDSEKCTCEGKDCCPCKKCGDNCKCNK